MEETSEGGVPPTVQKEVLDRIFGNSLAADWLLSKSEAPPVAVTAASMASAFSVSYSVAGESERSVTDELQNSLSDVFSRVEGSEGYSTDRMDVLLVPHWTFGSLIFATMLNTSPGTLEALDPGVSCRPVRRMVINLENSEGLELSTFSWLSNGMSAIMHCIFPRRGGLKSITFFLSSEWVNPSRPSVQDVVRVTQLIEKSGCQLCLLRGIPCECTTEMYIRMHPIADKRILTWDHWAKEFAKLRNRISDSSQSVLSKRESGLAEYRNRTLLTRVQTESRAPASSGLGTLLDALKRRYLASIMLSDPKCGASLSSVVLQTRGSPNLLSLPSTLCNSPAASSIRFNKVESDLETEAQPESFEAVRAQEMTSNPARPARTSRGVSTNILAEDSANAVEDRGDSSEYGSQAKRLRGDMERDALDVISLSSKRARILGAGSRTAAGGPDENYECTVCGKGFKRKFDLGRHVKSRHLLEKPFHCEKCNLFFAQKSHLVSHETMVHMPPKSLPCEHCDKTFTSVSNKNKHLRNVHNVDTTAQRG